MDFEVPETKCFNEEDFNKAIVDSYEYREFDSEIDITIYLIFCILKKLKIKWQRDDKRTYWMPSESITPFAQTILPLLQNLLVENKMDPYLENLECDSFELLRESSDEREKIFDSIIYCLKKKELNKIYRFFLIYLSVGLIDTCISKKKNALKNLIKNFAGENDLIKQREILKSIENFIKNEKNRITEIDEWLVLDDIERSSIEIIKFLFTHNEELKFKERVPKCMYPIIQKIYKNIINSLKYCYNNFGFTAIPFIKRIKI